MIDPLGPTIGCAITRECSRSPFLLPVLNPYPSQAVDVAMLKQTTMQNIMNIVMVLGFLAHGYATDEFQVTEERLGIYLPVRHDLFHPFLSVH